MRSSYKKIGSFVKQVNVRNKDLSVTNLQGININKFFMPSVANTNGTDLSKYKVVAQKQFAFNPMHVGRDKVLPISMLEEKESVIVSPAYTVFKVKDETQLLPEYLMMWCRRPEFDRNAWFTTDSSVRGGFSWKDFCDLTLPVPFIEKQREIVREYHTIVDRIKLNEQLNQKLEETAQAIYKQWFVDFEFPISKEHAAEIGKPELEGKPYKSSGGKMVWNDELDQEIPETWDYVPIQHLIDDGLIFKNQDGNHGEIHPKSSDFVTSGIPFIMASDLLNGVLSYRNCKFITKEQSDKLRIGFAKPGDVLLTHKATMGRVAIVPDGMDLVVLTPQVTYYRVKNKKLISKEFLYSLFNSTSFQNTLMGDSAQSTRNYLGITKQRSIKFLLSDPRSIMAFSGLLEPIHTKKMDIASEVNLLLGLQNLLHSKMTKAEATA